MVENKYKHKKNSLISKEQSLALLKRERKIFYSKIGSIFCPILDNEVHFTAQGYYHLIYESNSSQKNSNMRKSSEQHLKLMHLKHAPYIIKECVEIAESRVVRKKVKGIWKNGIQFELTTEIRNLGHVSVIIEKIGEGNYKFLSVFPKYKRPRYKKRPKQGRP